MLVTADLATADLGEDFSGGRQRGARNLDRRVPQFRAHDRLGALEENLLDRDLQHAARRWHASWAGFTPNHPPFGIGIAAWVEAVAALREALAPDGWNRSDEKNFALVVNAEKGIAINIAA